MPYRHANNLSIFRSYLWLVIAYTALTICGVLTFFAVPSTSLAEQGGQIIVIAWGLLCLLGGLGGLFGLFRRKLLVELIGNAFGGTASLLFVAALVLQAVHSGSAVPLTAASMLFTLTALLVQRWVDAWRPHR